MASTSRSIGGMPADWPPLEATKSVDRVVGVYKADLRLGHTLFLGEGAKAASATTFAISREGGPRPRP